MLLDVHLERAGEERNGRAETEEGDEAQGEGALAVALVLEGEVVVDLVLDVEGALGDQVGLEQP